MSQGHGVPDRAADAPVVAEGKAPNPHLTGILLFLVAVVLINGSDIAAKLSFGANVSVFQIALIQALGFLATGFIAARSLNARRILKTSNLRLQILRSSCVFVSALFYYKGLEALDLADIIAIILLGPLAVTVLAALILKERVGLRRWIACVIGFAGAMLIIRPWLGTDGIGWNALWPIGCVTLYAVHIIITRHLTATDSTSTIILWSPLVGVTVLSLAAPFYWTWPDTMTWIGLLAVAVFSGASNGLRIRSLLYAPASVLAPFGYAEIVGGTIAGFLIFGTFPDGWSWAGIAVIIGSGLYVWHRERVRGGSA
jgi:drug/metabolite transporter (DMT)-like permease